MKAKSRPLLISAAVLLAAGGAFLFSRDVTVLCLRNLDHARQRVFRVNPPERFYLYYRHSIYDAPVTEEFEAGCDGITLKGIWTSHPGVMEYYGFEQVRDFHRREVRFDRPLTLKRCLRQGQGVVVAGTPVGLERLAEVGERVELGVRSMPIWRYWISH